MVFYKSERSVAPTREYPVVMTTARPPSRYQQQPVRVLADLIGDREQSDHRGLSLTTAIPPTTGTRYRPITAAASRRKRTTTAPPVEVVHNYMYADSSVRNTVGSRQVSSCCRNASVLDCCQAAAGGRDAVSPGCCRTGCCRSSHFNITCCRSHLQSAPRQLTKGRNPLRNRSSHIDR